MGMYIHDLNCGWMDHSFFRTRFMLRKEEDLQRIRKSGIRELYVDTLKGLDVGDAPTIEQVDQELTQAIAEIPPEHTPPIRNTTHREEMVFAKNIHSEANGVVRNILADIRIGKQIQTEKVHPVVEKITESVFRNQGALLSLCRIKESDNYTFQHCVSVCTLIVSFCHSMGLAKDVIQEAGVGALLHDTGKMMIPDEILNKPAKLSDPEFEIMKTHVMKGVEILHKTPGITATMMMVAREHHERFDGTGYPEKLFGHEISQLGRMASIVDVYDAITSNRVYHRGMEPAEALKKMFEWSKHHFDEELVQHFIQSIGIYPVGSLVRLQSERLAIVVEQNPESLLSPVVRAVFDTRNRKWLEPFDLDLSIPESGGDRIMGYEIPENWRVDPFKFLTLPR